MEAKGRGEGDRGWLLARGSAMVAMVRCRNGWMGETSRGGSSPKGNYGGMDKKKAEKGGEEKRKGEESKSKSESRGRGEGRRVEDGGWRMEDGGLRTEEREW